MFQDVPLIWIHDYHLMEVGNIVRRVAAQDKLPCNIGFFMHIPFPSWDMVKIHPWKDIFLQVSMAKELHQNLLNINCFREFLGVTLLASSVKTMFLTSLVNSVV